MLKLFFWKFYLSSILPIIIDSKFLFDTLRESGTTYDDFTTAWYLQKGSGLIFGKSW